MDSTGRRHIPSLDECLPGQSLGPLAAKIPRRACDEWQVQHNDAAWASDGLGRLCRGLVGVKRAHWQQVSNAEKAYHPHTLSQWICWSCLGPVIQHKGIVHSLPQDLNLAGAGRRGLERHRAGGRKEVEGEGAQVIQLLTAQPAQSQTGITVPLVA